MRLDYDHDNRILKTPAHSVERVNDSDAWQVAPLGDTAVMFCGTLAECLDACADVELDLEEPDASPRVLDQYGQW